jgi:tRNA pseudouridine38-40 synthase
MRNIKLTIEYDGTNFNGWQVQAKGHRTVQGEIEKALRKIFKRKIRLVGSGRTDSGVHALGQVANFKTASKITTVEIQNAINSNTGKDLTVLNVEDVPINFHAQYSTKDKTYCYCILNRKAPCAQQRFFCLHIPQKLNLTAIRREAKALIGRKDFRSFMAMDPAKRDTIETKNTVRTIKRLEIRKKGDFIYIIIEANGFLYKMVRNIVGTLVEIGLGRLPEGCINTILRKKDRKFAGNTALAKGLCLDNVTY